MNLWPSEEDDTKMTRVSRDFSYLHQILDEICLEGLDGITLQVTLALLHNSDMRDSHEYIQI